jgi:hypothetical protein
MRKFQIILIVVCCSFAFASRGQDATTNAPQTEMEVFEAQTGVVIIKGFGQIGSVTTGAGVISVRCKESANATTGRKEYGLAIEFASGQQREISIVDYDEIDPLLNGMDYLGKITYDVTALPGFEASITIRSGLRVVAYSARRQGGIQNFLQFYDGLKISLASDQLAQFQNLIGQAKSSLDSLRTAK